MRNFHIPKRAASRIVSVFAVILLTVGAANAYTVIMRGGKRVEIPSHFTVTAATLTYEVTEGIQITIPMAAIDIPATEKANHELPGSLLGRMKVKTAEPVAKNGVDTWNNSSARRRTITNRDLETSMRRRKESEIAYESRRKELGLPSLEESRSRAAADFDLFTTELRQKRFAEKETEDYWRERAASLRTEMAAVDAELAYVRARLDEYPFATPFGDVGSFTSVDSFGGFGSFRGARNFGRPFENFGGGRPFPGQMQRPGIYVGPQADPQIRGRGGFGGGGTRGQVFGNRGNFGYGRQFGLGGSFSIFPGGTVLGSSPPAYDFSYERSELITRFNELAGARAGLNARFRELEEEARRAGVSPGWLRP